MNCWKYEILDAKTKTVLLADDGFECEADAELQASMEAKARGLKSYEVRTEQIWSDL